MVRGLYTSGWSMLALQKRMDVITNNMANASTYGFKRDITVMESFPDLMTKIVRDQDSLSKRPRNIGTMELGSDISEVYTNFSQGQLSKTDNELDMAIKDSDSAFFTVAARDAGGNVAVFFTRDGSFSRNSDNVLVTSDGYYVLGENGPVILRDGPFTVDENGYIMQDGEIIDRLLITEFTDTTVLRKYGNNLLQAGEDARTRAFSGTIQQGCVELSNVNIVREMVDMITVMRAYEASSRVLQAIDSTLDKAVNQIGTVR
ncbi:MAG TPA: flagellar hook-basal body protein [Clostridiales bacterium]|nr:flagellar hook-basal body protein [Clostridiales bacterium]